MSDFTTMSVVATLKLGNCNACLLRIELCIGFPPYIDIFIKEKQTAGGSDATKKGYKSHTKQSLFLLALIITFEQCM